MVGGGTCALLLKVGSVQLFVATRDTQALQFRMSGSDLISPCHPDGFAPGAPCLAFLDRPALPSDS